MNCPNPNLYVLEQKGKSYGIKTVKTEAFVSRNFQQEGL